MKQPLFPRALALAGRFSKPGTLPKLGTLLLGIALLGSPAPAWAEGGTVVAWGDNGLGQTDVPSGLSNVVAISAGEWHNLALKADGTVVAWGANNAGQRNVPPGLSGVVAIAACGYHNLALKSDGTVRAWGQNDFGQATVPAGLNNVVALAGGWTHSLALKADGTVVAWGRNHEGQATVPSDLNNVVAIAAGEYHNLALKADGTVTAWGWNGVGQTSVPAGLNNVVAIAASGLHNLALKSDGTVTAWGYNERGQATVPPGLNNVVALAGGVEHSLALKSDGTVVGWGSNEAWANNDCQFIGNTNCVRKPGGQISIPSGLGRVTAIAGGNFHSLALKAAGGGSVPNRYTLTLVTNGNGRITRNLNPGTDGEYASDALVTLTATPNSGAEFAGWNGPIEPGNSGNTATVRMNSDKTITANFRISTETNPVTYVVTTMANPANGGSVALNPDQAQYTSNQNVTATATPNAGFRFERWEGNPAGTSATAPSITFRVRNNVTLSAVFTPLASSNNVLAVLIQGEGRISPNYNGRSLVVGHRYSMTASPAANWLFSHWITPGGNVSTARLSFTMEEGLTLTAVFVPNRFGPVQGTYYGLVHASDATDPSVTGPFRITVSDRGTYSGIMQLGGRTFPVRGALNPTSGIGNLAVRPTGTDTIGLNLDDPQNTELTGTLSGVPLRGHRQAFTGTTSVAPQAGTYYLFFPGGDDTNSISTGDGYGKVTVDARGSVRISGVMADGSPFSQGTVISRDGRWPFYAALNGGRGMAVGWITFENAAGSSVRGRVDWIRPTTTSGVIRQGFHRVIDATGSLFIAPLPGVPVVNWVGGAGTAEIGGDNMAEKIVAPLSITSNNVIAVTGDNGSVVALRVSPSGALTGSFRHPVNNRPTAIRGATFQRQNAMGGFFVGQTAGGFVFADDTSNPVLAAPNALSGRSLNLTTSRRTGSFTFVDLDTLTFSDSSYTGTVTGGAAAVNFGPGTYDYAVGEVGELNLLGTVQGRPAATRLLLFYTTATSGTFLAQVTAGGTGVATGQFTVTP